MTIAANVFISLAALLHAYFFFLESIAWGRVRTNKIYGIKSQAEAETIRVYAFNQGFYNLFLALGIVAGLVMEYSGRIVEGHAVLVFCALSIMGAGLALFISVRKMWPASLIQAGPAALYLLLSYFS